MEQDLSAFIFVSQESEIASLIKGSFIARISPRIRNRQVLFTELASALKFPAYFGYNWDALYDVLCDLSWISQKNVGLIHADLPLQQEKENMRTYLETLHDAVHSWRQDNSIHSLFVVFPATYKQEVKKVFEEPAV